MIDRIKQQAAALFPEIQNLRRHLHAHPELSYQEEETAAFLKQTLESWGLEVQSGIGGHGMVVLVEGAQPGPVRAMRADFDALPIQEENEVEYASKRPGVMHACGHDVHTACVLGALKIIVENKESLKGTLKVILQPAEEKLPGGASLMIADGVLENPKVEGIIGQHVYPDLEVGKVGFRPGMYMASADEIYLKFKGSGGHAALPHKGVDTVMLMAQTLVQLQQVISRACPPDIPSVLSFGKVEAPGATNIIPAEVRVEGTFRAMNETWRKQAHALIRKTAKAYCEAWGGEVEVDIHVGYPYLENNPELTQASIQRAKDYLGEEAVVELDLRMTAEDFAYYSHHAPACFYRLGTRNEAKGLVHGLHTSRFDVDEKCLEIGMGLMAYHFLSH